MLSVYSCRGAVVIVYFALTTFAFRSLESTINVVEIIKCVYGACTGTYNCGWYMSNIICHSHLDSNGSTDKLTSGATNTEITIFHSVHLQNRSCRRAQYYCAGDFDSISAILESNKIFKDLQKYQQPINLRRPDRMYDPSIWETPSLPYWQRLESALGLIVSGFCFAELSDASRSGRPKLTHRRRRSTVPDPAKVIPLPGYTTAGLVGTGSSSSSLPQQQLLTGTRQFVVGDGATYGDYRNVPLSSDSLYSFYFVVALTLDGVTKMAFSQLVTSVRTVTALSPTSVSSTPPASGNGSSPGVHPTYGTYTTGGSSSSGQSSSGVVAAVVVVVLLVVAIAAAVVVGFLWMRRRRRRKQLEALVAATKSRRQTDRNGGPAAAETKRTPNHQWMQYYSNHFYDAFGRTRRRNNDGRAE
jgi:hypothetical protein